MKKIFKVLAIIAIVAVIGFSFITCDDDSGGGGGTGGNSGGDPTSGFTSIAAFKTWLDAQQDNTIETAYNVKLNVSDLGGKYDTAGSAGKALRANINKYVSLDLSDSTFTSTEQAFSGCNNLTNVIIPNSVTSVHTPVLSIAL
jgi:hypothetical protein